MNINFSKLSETGKVVMGVSPCVLHEDGSSSISQSSALTSEYLKDHIFEVWRKI